MTKYIYIIIILISNFFICSCTEDISQNAPNGLVVILKADDLGETTANWNRFMKIIEDDSICAGIGVIANNVKTESSKIEIQRESALKQKNNFSIIEFWNHGYDHSKIRGKTEFDGTDFDFQMNHIQKAQKFFTDSLHLSSHCFGAPFNRTTHITDEVLKSFPEINIWQCYEDIEKQHHSEWKDPDKKIIKSEDQHILLNVNYLYYHGFPIDNILNNYEKDKNKPYILIQIHPAVWNDKNFDSFEKLIHFYKTNKRATFMTPYQYYQFLHKHYNANEI